MKNKLFKRASAINAVKCNKSIDFKEATASFDKLQEIRKKLENLEESKLTEIENEIKIWEDSNPIASEKNINEILKRK